jgi:hypothetical protein
LKTCFFRLQKKRGAPAEESLVTSSLTFYYWIPVLEPEKHFIHTRLLLLCRRQALGHKSGNLSHFVMILFTMISSLRNIRRSASPHFISVARRLSSTFGLNDMQQSIKATAAAFANSDLAPKAASVDRNHAFPKEAVQRMGEMGFMGIPVPEQYALHPPLPPPPITSRVLLSGTAAPGSIMSRTPTRISSEHVVADLRVLTLLIASDMLLPWRKSAAAAPLPVLS